MPADPFFLRINSIIGKSCIADQGVTRLISSRQGGKHHVNRKIGGANGTYIKGGEDFFPFWVKNTRQHRFDVKNFPGHLTDHNVDVVVLGHGQNSVTALDPSLLEHVLVNWHAADRVARKI